jgi:hypothetical protein
LNSRVQASKSQGNGAALSVIADAVHQLSLSAKRDIGDVVKRITSLVGIAGAMRSLADGHDAAKSVEEAIQSMNAEIEAIVRALHESDTTGTGTLHSTVFSCTELGAVLESMVAELREYQGDADTLEQVEAVLAGIARDARSRASSATLAQVEKTRFQMETLGAGGEPRGFEPVGSLLIGSAAGAGSTAGPEEAGSIELF